MCPFGYYKATRQEATNLQYTMVFGERGTASLGHVKHILFSMARNIPIRLLEYWEFIGVHSITIVFLLGVDEAIS
jgi:hypothetical protein